MPRLAPAIGFWTLAVLALVLAGCADRKGLRPFTTDGCSMFPDRALIGEGDWCDCCLAHDIAYWRGGTQDERLTADRALQQCVLKATATPGLANTMFDGVRAGGTPLLPTSFRWGYGWSYERGYRALTAEERASADALLANSKETTFCQARVRVQK